MFRPIRKKKNEISTEEALALLQDSRRGVLAVNGDNGYPYAIPVNYYFDKENKKIYFHGAKSGHKIDAIKNCDKVSFCVYDNVNIVIIYIFVHFLTTCTCDFYAYIVQK